VFGLHKSKNYVAYHLVVYDLEDTTGEIKYKFVSNFVEHTYL